MSALSREPHVGESMIPLDETVLQRLAVVKHWYRLGCNVSLMPPPSSTAAISLFHDAAETILSLAVGRLCSKVDATNLTFAGYFEKLEGVSCTLPHKSEMLRLNKVRVNVKHQAVIQSSETVEEMRAVTTMFLSDAGLVLFGCSVLAVSELQLIGDAEARVELEEAESDVSRGDFKQAIAHAAVAFHGLMDRHEIRWADAWGKSPFRSRERGLAFAQERELGPLAGYFRNIKRETDEIRAMVRDLAFRVDYARYVKFMSIAPHVHALADGTYRPAWVGDPRVPDERTEEHARFCIDFVIDTALEFQRVTAEPLRGNPPPTLW